MVSIICGTWEVRPEVSQRQVGQRQTKGFGYNCLSVIKCGLAQNCSPCTSPYILYVLVPLS